MGPVLAVEAGVGAGIWRGDGGVGVSVAVLPLRSVVLAVYTSIAHAIAAVVLHTSGGMHPAPRFMSAALCPILLSYSYSESYFAHGFAFLGAGIFLC